jgi:hypothetical protein
MRHNTPERSALTRGINYRHVLLVAGLGILGAMVLALVAHRTNNNIENRTCISNIRQMGIALVLYAEDNNGTMPPYTNLEAKLAAKARKPAPTSSNEPALLRAALHLYTDDSRWFCPLDPESGKPKYYLGIRHGYTSYAFPEYKDTAGNPAKLNDIPATIGYGIVWDAAGDRNSCEPGLWFAGSRNVASNHPDGRVNVVLSNLGLRQVPAVLPNGAGIAP